MAYGDGCVDPAEKQKLLRPVPELFKFTGAWNNSEFFTQDLYTNLLSCPNF